MIKLEAVMGEWARHEAQFPNTARLLQQAVESAHQEGAPEVFAGFRKVYPEIPLEDDLSAQRQMIMERVVKPLGLNAGDTLKELTFPFPKRKESYRRELSIPVIVPQFRGVSFLEAADAAGFYISDYLRGMITSNEVHPWVDSRRVDIPEGPHGAWIQDGSLFVKRRPIDVRDELQTKGNSDLLAGGLWKGYSIALLRFDMVDGKGWDLIGDSVGSGLVPYLRRWYGKPRFDASWGGHAHPYDRALVCGS